MDDPSAAVDPGDPVAAAKREMRGRMRSIRAEIVAEGSAGRRSSTIVDRVIELEPVLTARRIVAYRSLPGEVGTTRLVDWCRHREVEVVVSEPHPSAPFPVDAGWADVIIVPGVAMTRSGQRLGQGGGWYDRFLAGRRVDCRAIGLVFLPQLVDDLPTEPHDAQLDCVVSEDGAWWAP